MSTAPSAQETFARTHLAINKQQVVAWVLLGAGVLIQGAFLAILLYITFHIRSQLQHCETEPTDILKCPTPGEITPIWVLLLASAALGLLFVLLAGFAFMRAHV